MVKLSTIVSESHLREFGADKNWNYYGSLPGKWQKVIDENGQQIRRYCLGIYRKVFRFTKKSFFVFLFLNNSRLLSRQLYTIYGRDYF